MSPRAPSTQSQDTVRASGARKGAPVPRADTSRARYVAIITDGNGRWARARGLPVNDGHDAGADTVKARLRDAAELGRRGADRLLVLDGELVAAPRGGAGPDGDVREAHLARRRPSCTRKACACASSAAAKASPPTSSSAWPGRKRSPTPTTRITLFVAFNYGGRAEILDAARAFQGGDEAGLSQAALRTGDARPRSDHPHQRRAASLQLPAVAVGLL